MAEKKTGFKGLPLVEQRTRTWRWYLAQVLGVISIVCLAAWIGWLIWGPDKTYVGLGLFMGMAIGFMFAAGFEVENDSLYIIPPRAEWGSYTLFWQVSADGSVTEAFEGMRNREEIFSMTDGDVIELQSIVRQTPHGNVLESHGVRLRVTDKSAAAAASFLNWFDNHSDADKLPPTDRFAKHLEREAQRTDLPFRLEVLPKPIAFKAG